MNINNSHQFTKRLLAAAIGITTLIGPLAAKAAGDNPAEPGQAAQMQLALGSTTRDYFPAADPRPTNLQSLTAEERWAKIQQTLRPDLLVKLSEAFAKDFPGSQHSAANEGLLSGAQKSLAALRAARLSATTVEEHSGDSGYRAELTGALRGDKDAAGRIAAMYRRGSNGLTGDAHRAEQWLHVAAELGNGNASWQVAQIYNRSGLMGDAAKFESKAVEAGFHLPVRLPTRDMNI